MSTRLSNFLASFSSFRPSLIGESADDVRHSTSFVTDVRVAVVIILGKDTRCREVYPDVAAGFHKITPVWPKSLVIIRNACALIGSSRRRMAYHQGGEGRLV